MGVYVVDVKFRDLKRRMSFIKEKLADAHQQRDTTATVLAGEKASKKTTRTFVRSSDEAVEGAMLSCHLAFGMLSASRALTGMDEPPWLPLGQTFLLGHRTLPPFGQAAKGAARLLYSLIAEVTDGQ